MKILAIAFTTFLVSCQNEGTKSSVTAKAASTAFHIGADVLDAASIANANTKQSSYISVRTPFSGINALKRQIEGAMGLKLKDRGEAHITVVTPPEMTSLRSRLSAGEILDALDVASIQHTSFEPICVGAGSKGNKRVFFVVVTSQDLNERREALAIAFAKAGGAAKAFDARRFFAHITVGFTDTDLHEQDGVIKDERSCVSPLVVEH